MFFTADKKSFMVYYDTFDQIKILSNEQTGLLFKAVYDYEINQVVPDFSNDQVLRMCFLFFQKTLDRDKEKYYEKCQKNAENGAKGGRPPKNQSEMPYTATAPRTASCKAALLSRLQQENDI